MISDGLLIVVLSIKDKLGNNKNGGSGLQLKQELIHHTLDAVPIHHNHHHHHHHLATFVDLTDFNSAGTGSSSSTTTTSLEDMDTDQVHHHQQSSPSNKSSHTASSGGLCLSKICLILCLNFSDFLFIKSLFRQFLYPI